jgi:flavin-dependent dehydrogenase
MRARHDVVVVGGGPAGLAAALSLVSAGLSVAVLERSGYDSLRVGEHLPPGAKPLLADLGLTAVLQQDGHAACPGIRSVWGSDEVIEKDYLFNPHGEGMNLFRPRFDRSLAREAAARGVAMSTRAKLLDVARRAGTWTIAASCDGARREHEAAFVIDASGRSAGFAKRLGARPIVHDNLIGLFARCRAASKDRRIHIEAQEQGWWYAAGLADDSLVATFMTDADLIDDCGASRAAFWREQIDRTRLIRRHADLDAAVDDVHVRSARTQRLDRIAGDGWLALGDAAMSFDPLSSDGLAKAFEVGMRAAAVAAACCGGDRSRLRDYEEDAENRFAKYLRGRLQNYRAERRWTRSAFWLRRQAGAAEPARVAQ